MMYIWDLVIKHSDVASFGDIVSRRSGLKRHGARLDMVRAFLWINEKDGVMDSSCIFFRMGPSPTSIVITPCYGWCFPASDFVPCPS